MHIGIIGAGVSGLYSSLLLRREGYKFTIFESANRVGGRIYTHRFTSPSAAEDVYFEAGAMRIPRSALHSRVFQLIDYLNAHIDLPEYRIELIPYILQSEHNQAFFRKRKAPFEDRAWALKASLPEQYQQKTPRELLHSVISPWLKLLQDDFEAGFERLLKFDELSFRSYLRLVAQWPHEVIEFVEFFCSQTNQYDLCFVDLIIQNLDFDTKDWVTVRSGMSRIPQAASYLIGWKNIRLNSKVERIVNLPDGRVELTAREPANKLHVEVFDAIVVAVPPSALHNIVERPIWSFMKEQSIRGTHYEPLYKIGLCFRTRFWERSTIRPCFGGQSVTDLRFRWIIFPSNDLGSAGSGVLLLYCWMSDAAKWSTLPREERVQVCLHDLTRYYADEPDVDVYREFVEAFDVLWSAESSGGDAMFLPGQFTRFYKVAKKREKSIYFAGEHLSRHHTWIAGAIDSSLETTSELMKRHPRKCTEDIKGKRLPVDMELDVCTEKLAPLSFK